MLTRNGKPFTIGYARYYDEDPDASTTNARIFVKIEPRDLGASILALLDTAAPWCILHPDLAIAIGMSLDDGVEIELSTRLGKFLGRLQRIPITLFADEGESLEVEATVFLSADWPGQNFVGYNGLLERIRFAIDPRENAFHFGP